MILTVCTSSLNCIQLLNFRVIVILPQRKRLKAIGWNSGYCTSWRIILRLFILLQVVYNRTFIFILCRSNIFVSNSIFLNIDWSLTGFSKNGLWLLIWFCQGSHMKHNPKLLKESVDKSLEMLQQGKLRGPHIFGQFELDQVSWN